MSQPPPAPPELSFRASPNDIDATHAAALALLGRANEIALGLSQATGRKVGLACFPLYADEATIVPETATHHARKRFQFLTDRDVCGRFGGLLFSGADDRTTVCVCRIGDQDAWSTPLSSGLFESLDWTGEAYPTAPIEPGTQITIELFGSFVCVALLVVKANSQNP
jgi:hypothetical protein